MLQLADETEKLIKLIADRTGKTPDDVVREAVEARALAAGLGARQRKLDRKDLIAGMEAIALRCAGLPVRDARSADEIIGYDAGGLSRS